jgi:hypothetical protein
MIGFHSFLWLNTIAHCICPTFSLSIHHLVGHLGCFHFLDIVNSIAVNMIVQMFIFFSYRAILIFPPLSIYLIMVLLDPIVVLFFNFLRNLHGVFHNSYTNLHSHWQYSRAPFSPYPHQHLLSLVFLIIAILTEMISHCDFFTCISLMINDLKHFDYLCLLLWTIYVGLLPWNTYFPSFSLRQQSKGHTINFSF